MTVFSDDMTVARARGRLVAGLDDGVVCPVCGQTAKRYARQLDVVATRVVVEMFRHHGQGWVHLPTLAKDRLADIAHRGGALSMSHHWGVIESRSGDAGRGWWRVTDRGVAWLAGRLRLPSHALVFNNVADGFAGALIGPGDVDGSGFDFDELWRARPMPVSDQDRLWTEAA